jgi:hypothetical protein
VRWSPRQISGWLVEEYPSDPEMRVSHETIYLSVFVQSRGALRKELTSLLCNAGHDPRMAAPDHSSPLDLCQSSRTTPAQPRDGRAQPATARLSTTVSNPRFTIPGVFGSEGLWHVLLVIAGPHLVAHQKWV